MNVQRLLRALNRGRARALNREPALAAVYQRIIREQASKAARALVSEAGLTAAVAPRDWQPPPEGVIFTPVGVTAALQRQHLQAVESVARPALEHEGIAWNPDDPRLQELLAQTGDWSGQAVTDAMLPELRKLVASAFADGLSVKDAAALIRAKFAETAPWQAEMLARSNLNMLGNAGMDHAVARYNDTARATGDRQVETKTWRTAGDSAVRPTHVAAEGQTVPVGQSFQVGGSSLSFPGDPGGPLGEVLNCRCAVLYGSAPRSGLTAAVRSPAVTKLRQRPSRRAAGSNVILEEIRDELLAETAAAIATQTVEWVSDLAFEGRPTGDGRFFLPGAVTWRELPIPLKAMTVDGPGGHEGSFLAGKITSIRRDTKTDMEGEPLPEGVVAIRGRGIFDMEGESGAEVARLVGDEFMRGVSVDPGSVTMVFRDPGSGQTWTAREADADVIERAMFGEIQTAFSAYEIAAATVCPTPAFADARIALRASGERIVQLRAHFELVSSTEGKMGECPCADASTATEKSLGSETAEAATASLATRDDERPGRSPSRFARSAARPSSVAVADRSSARTADLSATDDTSALISRSSAPKVSPSGEWRPRLRRSDGPQLREAVESSELDRSASALESSSAGTNSRLSSKPKESVVRSARSRSTTSRGEGQSRTLTSTISPERSSSEAGSADRAIEGLAASATTQNGSKRRRNTSGQVAPLKPPREWFYATEVPGPCPITITSDGRVFGHIALWETCHTGFADACVTPPRSPTGYKRFHVGSIETAEGDLIAIGKIMLGSKHSPLSMSAHDAARHYDDNGMVGAYVRAQDGQHGIWVNGSLRHDLPAARLRDFRANPPSGDWRGFSGSLDLIAALAVPVPGYPVPRAETGLTASGGTITVTALIASPGHVDLTPAVMEALIAAGLITEDEAESDDLTGDGDFDRQLRVLEAREQGVDGLAALIG